MEFSKIGAISYWAGATSLWRVLTGMPSRRISISDSIMKASTRSGIEPKYLASSASPVQEAKAVGMQSSAPFGFSRMKAGLVGSQAV